MTEKMAHNREKMGAKLKVLNFILVLYSQPHCATDKTMKRRFERRRICGGKVIWYHRFEKV